MTDVINGVPRELRSVLSMILSALDRDAAEGKTVRGEMAEELRRILATAQPAADGDREAFIRSFNLDGKIYYDENTRQWLPCRDSVEGFQIAQRATEVWIGWQARAAQPQQAVVVTDDVRRLREALEVCVEVIERFSYRWNGQGKHPQMALNGAKAALTQSPKGEQE